MRGRSIRLRMRWAAVPVLGAAARVLQAQEPAPADTTPVKLPTVVSVTREPARNPLTLPYAVTVATPDSARPGQAHLALDQALMLVPGAVVSPRFNPSQDPRLSIRGFGARSAFGVRSIRVLRDGMPLTLPDGQTPVDVLDLETVGTVEVIRGAASSLYGNASGGVIDLRSGPVSGRPVSGQVRSWGGSGDLRRIAGVLDGTAGPIGYQGGLDHTTVQGARDYSHQRLSQAYVRVVAERDRDEFAVQLLVHDMPLGENPGALTRAQLDSAPWMADPASVRKRARKSVQQVQGGVSARHATTAGGEISGQLFAGTRSLDNPLTFAIVGVERLLGGASARVVQPIAVAGATHRVTIGADLQALRDDRRNWANCNAVPTANASCPGTGAERGALQLDQRERVGNAGGYLRDELALGALTLSAGVRADAVRFDVTDRYLADGRDDSGRRTMRAVSPMAGVVWRLAPAHSAYATVATAFETPTTTELGNHPDGTAGVNQDLAPQRSTTWEAGVRGIGARGLRYGVTGFITGVADELIPFEVPGGNGRSYFRNAGSTRRGGAELELGARAGAFEWGASYAWSHFRFRRFAVSDVAYAGNVIPGVPDHVGQGSLTWRDARTFITSEAVARSSMYANDANTVKVPGYVVVNLRAGLLPRAAGAWLAPVVAVQNLFDRRYVSSVAINAAGTPATAKYYEPAPGRTWLVGLSVGTPR